MSEARERIWQLVRAANDAWTSGRPSDTAPLFHPSVVMLSTSGEVLVEGREAMVGSFVQYCERARTHSFEELEPDVRVFGDTAIVTYVFDVEYEIDGQRHRERGRELLVFGRDEDTWRAVSRQQLKLEAS